MSINLFCRQIHDVEPLKQATECIEKDTSPRTELRKEQYLVMYNYIGAKKTFLCNQTITYTTQAEFVYLFNLETTLQRWQGPISVAVYTPGAFVFYGIKF